MQHEVATGEPTAPRKVNTKATLVQVAARAGVSVATASRVLNGGRTTPETARRTRQAATELQYTANAVGRGLRTRQTFQIAMAVADIGNPVYVAMMRAIEHGLRATGYRLLVHSTSADADAEMDFLAGMRQGYVDGVILQTLRGRPELTDAVRELAIPAVVIGNIDEDIALDAVRTDSRTGIGLAVEHLLHNGHRRLALLNGPADTAPGAARLRGFTETATRSGVTPDPKLTVTCADFTHLAGYDAARVLLSSNNAQPEAIVCANDLIAMGALRALTEAGLRVPDDVALTGLDDIDLAAMCTPALTSVDMGARQRGELAVELLLARLTDPDRPTQRCFVQPSLVVRQSSSTAPSPTPRLRQRSSNNPEEREDL